MNTMGIVSCHHMHAILQLYQVSCILVYLIIDASDTHDQKFLIGKSLPTDKKETVSRAGEDELVQGPLYGHTGNIVHPGVPSKHLR